MHFLKSDQKNNIMDDHRGSGCIPVYFGIQTVCRGEPDEPLFSLLANDTPSAIASCGPR